MCFSCYLFSFLGLLVCKAMRVFSCPDERKGVNTHKHTHTRFGVFSIYPCIKKDIESQHKRNKLNKWSLVKSKLKLLARHLFLKNPKRFVLLGSFFFCSYLDVLTVCLLCALIAFMLHSNDDDDDDYDDWYLNNIDRKCAVCAVIVCVYETRRVAFLCLPINFALFLTLLLFD